MNAKKLQLDTFRKFLLNRVTATSHLSDHIENYLTTEEEAVQHTFHKIMVHNWNGTEVELFEVMSEYFSTSFIPVNYVSQGDVSIFHTSNLNLILKIIKLDFLFPHARNMYNVDVLFNDKSSLDVFENHIKIEDVVAGVVSGRLNETLELDLSNFRQDPEFLQKKIFFYKLSLLSNYKILMLRMGRDTKSLNLSNNNLSQVPVEILNFFIKGDLIAVNLSNNNIPSMTELHRVSSKIEKLWVEGNPLCEDIEPVAFVKQILMKFPRLTELDGIRINEHGVAIPCFKNYLETPDRRTKMLVEKFLTLYFTHYDMIPRDSIDMFYLANAKMSISTTFTDGDEKQMPHYTNYSRNVQHLSKRRSFPGKLINGRSKIAAALATFPASEHDPATFTVDVLKHDKKSLVLIVDGTLRERAHNSEEYNYLRFRRTFIFTIHIRSTTTTEYFIADEMIHLYPATKHLIENGFKTPRCNNPLSLFDPEREEIDALCNVFCHLTQLKKPEAETRLRVFGWDITKAMNAFMKDLTSNKLAEDRFVENDDLSDLSSLLDDDID